MMKHLPDDSVSQRQWKDNEPPLCAEFQTDWCEDTTDWQCQKYVDILPFSSQLVIHFFTFVLFVSF